MSLAADRQDLDRARAAKDSLRTLLSGTDSVLTTPVLGVGIEREDEGFALRLVVSAESPELPAEHDGFPVRQRTVGSIEAQG